MQFVVRRRFKWGGNDQLHEVGATLEIPEGHPRLEGLFLGRFIAYSSSQDVPAGIGKQDIPQPVAKPGRKGKARANA